jgi:NADP-dependent 3-hydroxy acid dehydrogenase YdfG
MKIKNKVVLVTGASSGIGMATAELFNKKGAKVVLAAHSTKEAEEIAANLPDSHVMAVDMTKPQEIQRMVQETHAHYGRIDILINNAGQESHSPMEHVDVNDFARLMAFNVYGPLVAMQTTIPLMKEQGGGAIVNVSSGIAKAVQRTVVQHVNKKSARKTKFLNSRTEFGDQDVSVSLVYHSEPAAGYHPHSFENKVRHAEVQSDTTESYLPKTVAAKILETVEKRKSR